MYKNLLESVLSLLPVILSGAFTLGVLYYSYVWLPMKMRKVYRQSLLTLSRAVETKDTGCEGRGERVADYATAIARVIGVPRCKQIMIEYAAFLQDVGHVRVPHSILDKTEPLTEDETTVLETHSIIGADIVLQVKFLKDTAKIIRHHHEIWDGSGYPDGLKGTDIPLGSRILAVCTAYDIMVRPRCGGSDLCRDDVLLWLREQSGIQYDPAVVDAFLKVMKEQNLD
ncbi:MAG: HD-GYP domain-containing protein [Armatimonadota bacterium]